MIVCVSTALASPNVVLPATSKSVPTYNFLAIPTPPANVAAATEVELASSTFDTTSFGTAPNVIASVLLVVSILI